MKKAEKRKGILAALLDAPIDILYEVRLPGMYVVAVSLLTDFAASVSCRPSLSFEGFPRAEGFLLIQE